MILNTKENIEQQAQKIFESIHNSENKTEDIINKLQNLLKKNIEKAYELIEINIKHHESINQKFDNIINNMKDNHINHENIHKIKQDCQSVLELNQTTKEKFIDVYKIIEKNKILLDVMKNVENKIENNPSALEKVNSTNKSKFAHFKNDLQLYNDVSNQNEWHILNFKDNTIRYEKMIENITKTIDDFQNTNVSTLLIDKKASSQRILKLRTNNENNKNSNNLG